jgi:hypothetical protein
MQYRRAHAAEAREGFRLDLTARATVTYNSYEELPKAIVQFLDVGQYARPRMVLTADERVHAAPGERRYWFAGS